MVEAARVQQLLKTPGQSSEQTTYMHRGLIKPDERRSEGLTIKVARIVD